MPTAKNEARSGWMPALIVVLIAVVGVQSFLLVKVLRSNAERDDAHAEEQIERVRVPDPPPRMTPAPPPPSASIDPFSAIDTWDPFAELERMRSQMSSLFDDSFNRFRTSPAFGDLGSGLSFTPQLDLQEEKDRYVVRIDLPGADKSTMDVSINDRQLTVSGTIDQRSETTDGNTVLRQERRTGQFRRSITLPGPVKADEMKAEYKDGVLIVTVPRARDTYRAKRVEVL